jgi:BlaI family transcriptional regulator, penicillinase repressor
MKLTRAEEEIMQYLWDYGPSTVSAVIERMEDPKPAHSSVSTIVRILEKKGFVDHKSFGKTFEYFPVISKSDYTRFSLKKLVQGYFDGSVKNMLSFLINEEELSLSDIERLRKELKDFDSN